MSRFLITALLAACGTNALFAANCFAVDATEPTRSKQLASIKLTDVGGKAWAPFANQQTKAVVLVFVSTDCPIANAFQPTLQQIHKSYADKGVACFMVYSLSNTSAAKVRKHVDDYRITMPAVLDNKQSVARLTKAQVTPEAVVFDRSGRVRYRGLINNLYAGYGKKRQAASEHYLSDALGSLVAGQNVAVPETKAIGCFIELKETSTASKTLAERKDDYDPRNSSGKVTVVDTQFSYGEKKRVVPLRFYLPESDAAPVILFSHGLGGSRENNKFLGDHWAGRGYAVVVMQHEGSDIRVAENVPGLQKFGALTAAASGKSAMDRNADVKATLDHIQSLNRAGENSLEFLAWGRQSPSAFDMTKVGMSGHSFGAITTQAVSGQTYARLGKKFTDKRIKAAVAFSPSPPRFGNNKDTFGDVSIPWLVMTGTKDNSVFGNRIDAAARRKVFQQLPKTNMFYELVFDGGEHMAFSDANLRFAKTKRNSKHHPAIEAITTAFWDAHLKGDKNAKAWLVGSGPRTMLDSADVWQKK